MRDLDKWWTSAEWLARAQSWIHQVLSEKSIRLTGPITQPLVRFWSVHLHVPTDAGLLWFKENGPASAFEAGLIDALAELTPQRVITPLAVDTGRGWLLSPDAGPTLRAAAGGQVGDWIRIVSEFAQWQRDLSAHSAQLLDAGLPVLANANAVALVDAEATALAALPAPDPRSLDVRQVAQIRAGLPLLTDAVRILDAAPVPPSLQHNDLHANNTFPPASGRLRFFDFGDALWGHPFAVLMVPLQTLHRTGADQADLTRVRDAYLEVFTDLHSRANLLPMVAAAERLAAVHRYFVWRAVIAHAPVDELATWGPRTTAWLTKATSAEAPDP